MQTYYFYINLSTHEYLPYYQGKVKDIIVSSSTGKRVQFPAMHLRSFLTSSGVEGYFCLQTENNKFVSLKKMTK
ncbi:DUF2835 domain-containing protein [Thalassotalea hakodatensis]|uniref:DUF2835 domain-containing protein n=1 Tax=Thalassotalea hakodatensis TaxID=3030492 RepID=UPI002573E6B6|nr:DUF2835 domain-containing protein [Thalassotalea hakodatensis]